MGVSPTDSSPRGHRLLRESFFFFEKEDPRGLNFTPFLLSQKAPDGSRGVSAGGQKYLKFLFPPPAPSSPSHRA
jgi:hypothetical protein